MAVLMRFKPFMGSKVFRFVDPDSGYKYAADSRAHLVRDIVSYRSLNQLSPIEHLDMVIESYLCGLPENCGSCEPYELKRGFLATIKGGITLLEWVLFPAEHTATQEVAEERAAQCATCKFNIFPDKTTFVKWSDDIALECVGDKRTTHHKELGNCEACSCVLRAKVFYKGDMKLTEEQKVKMRTVNCWQLKD